MALTTRVSTLNNHQILLSNFSKLQGDLTTLQRQISSGKKANIFAQLTGRVERVTGLENKLKTLNQYQENNNVVITRLRTMETVTSDSGGSLQTLADATVSLIIQSRGATQSQHPIFAQSMQDNLTKAAALLNTNIAGRYLFAGSKSNVPPVIEPVPDNVILGTPDKNYYQGDDVVQQVRAMDNLLLDYGVKADEPEFQDLIAAMKTAFTALQTSDDSLLEDALVLANRATEGINTVTSRIRGNILSLENANDLHFATFSYIRGVHGEEVSTDIVAASTDVATNEGILQAAFQAFSRTSELRLSSFLR